MHRKAWLLWAVVMLVLAPLSVSLAQKPELQFVTQDALKGRLGDPKVLIIDVRSPKDWSASDKKIPGAVRQEPSKAATWGPTLPKDKEIVLYCA
ncbi:MAG: hypothetical protein FJ126_00850 [Deltaproteobacteria bacterium]|nr:hypothetical protein [Deltaproteobacteria bacterium]